MGSIRSVDDWIITLAIRRLRGTFFTQTKTVKKSDRFTGFKQQDHNRKKGCIDDWSSQADASVDTIVLGMKP